MDRLEATYFTLCQPSRNNCSAVVYYMADYFKQKGLYFESSKDLCEGDIVFFQNSNGLSHVGLCIEWGDTTFITVEGNKGDAVAYGEYRYSQVGGYVAGFAHPRYNENITVEDAIAYAVSQLGYTEGANNWNKYAAELDAIEPYGYFADCGKKQFLPWCAVFICAVMYNAYKETPSPEPPTPPTPPTPTDKYTVSTNSGDALRLRAAPNVDSEQVGYIDNGSTIEAIDVVEGESIGNVTAWVKTSDGHFYGDNSVGYASGKYLTPTPEVKPSPEPPSPPTPTVKRYRVSTNSGDALRLRAEPNTDSEQVGYIDNGTIIDVIEIVEGESIGYVTTWALTNCGQHYGGATCGFCSMKYLEEV